MLLEISETHYINFQKITEIVKIGPKDRPWRVIYASEGMEYIDISQDRFEKIKNTLNRAGLM